MIFSVVCTFPAITKGHFCGHEKPCPYWTAQCELREFSSLEKAWIPGIPACCPEGATFSPSPNMSHSSCLLWSTHLPCEDGGCILVLLAMAIWGPKILHKQWRTCYLLLFLSINYKTSSQIRIKSFCYTTKMCEVFLCHFPCLVTSTASSACGCVYGRGSSRKKKANLPNLFIFLEV